ncbi:MAG: DUF934 domain-containing protein [Rhodospirillales bacterium]|nr:DUF934 domain-containing protein [Rhodospirillales bacterium]
MPLLKDGKLVDDGWLQLDDDAVLPEAGAVVVSLARWQQDRDHLIARTGPVGVRLTADQTPGLIRADLDELALVALEFPAFTNGRAYSYARLLHRYGFAGEIRAVGNVLRDQYWNMQRCGFNALEIEAGETEADWVATVTHYSAPYQVAHDPALPVMSLRERRMAAAAQG